MQVREGFKTARNRNAGQRAAVRAERGERTKNPEEKGWTSEFVFPSEAIPRKEDAVAWGERNRQEKSNIRETVSSRYGFMGLWECKNHGNNKKCGRIWKSKIAIRKISGCPQCALGSGYNAAKFSSLVDSILSRLGAFNEAQLYLYAAAALPRC